VFAQHSMQHSVLGLPAHARARSALALPVDALPG
jgi:hypothetical protein